MAGPNSEAGARAQDRAACRRSLCGVGSFAASWGAAAPSVAQEPAPPSTATDVAQPSTSWLDPIWTAWLAMDTTTRVAALAALAWLTIVIFGFGARRLRRWSARVSAPRPAMDTDVPRPSDTDPASSAVELKLAAPPEVRAPGGADATPSTASLLRDAGARRREALRRGSQLTGGVDGVARGDEDLENGGAAYDALRRAAEELTRRIHAIAARETAARKSRERANGAAAESDR